MDERICTTIGIGLFAWISLYISDYWFTLTRARMYQAGVNQKLVFEGSYELTPYYQRDVDALRRFSPRFFVMLLCSTVLLCLAWNVREDIPNLYPILLGALVLVEFAVHIRHVRNFYLFREALLDESVMRGKIEYSRPLVLRLSAIELIAFGTVYFLLMIAARSWFLFGGALACFIVASKHRQLAQKHLSPTISGEQGPISSENGPSVCEMTWGSSPAPGDA